MTIVLYGWLVELAALMFTCTNNSHAVLWEGRLCECPRCGQRRCAIIAAIVADNCFASRTPYTHTHTHTYTHTHTHTQGVYLTLLEIALALRHLHSRRLVHRGE